MNTINTIITIERDIAPEPPDSLGTELVPTEVLPLAEPFAREAAWIRAAHAQIGHDHLVIVARSIGIGEQLERIKAALDKERYGEWGRW